MGKTLHMFMMYYKQKIRDYLIIILLWYFEKNNQYNYHWNNF